MRPTVAEPQEFRELLRRSSPEAAARAVLGGLLVHGPVAVRVLEVEAYGGPADSAHPDAAAHTWPGPTPRNSVMFGDAGHLYVYLSHGIHHCVNITCRPEGVGGGVLLRAGRVERGLDEVAARRPGVRREQLARGPGNLGRAVDVDLGLRGTDLLTSSSSSPGAPPSSPSSSQSPDPRPTVPYFLPAPVAADQIRSGPRVGVAREADRPWRFWVAGAREVSAYRRSPRARPARHPRPVPRDLHDGGQWGA